MDLFQWITFEPRYPLTTHMIGLIKGFITPILHFTRSIHFLIFLNGILLASVFFFATESNYDRQLFDIISHKIKREYPFFLEKDSFALEAMRITNELQERRYEIFGDEPLEGFKAKIMHPATVDLMTANGACGSYVSVLARILKANNYKVRIIQMQVRNRPAGHIVIEAFSVNKWIVLDPVFNQVFVQPDGHLADAKTVSSNWSYYKHQIKKSYPPEYSYDSFSYTNWNKIPVVMPAIKKLLDFAIGKEKADLISLRPVFLRVYHISCLITLIVYVMLLLYTFKRAFGKRIITDRPE